MVWVSSRPVRLLCWSVSPRVLGLSFICAVLMPYSVAHGQEDSVTIVGQVARNVVVRYVIDTNTQEEIYHSDGYIRRLTVSPDGEYIGVGERRSVGGSPADLSDRLVILNRAGQVLKTVEAVAGREVFDHTWCCGSGYLAVIVGSRKEGAAGGFHSEDVYVIGVASGYSRHLDGIVGPRDMFWDPVDSSLYVKAFGPDRAAVYRYHGPSESLSLTPHHGVFFSPDRRYYFDPSREGGGFRLFLTASDREVTRELRLSAQQEMFGPVGGWMPGQNHVLVFQEYPARDVPSERQRGDVVIRPTREADSGREDLSYVMIDAGTGQVVDRFQGVVGAWKTNAPALAVARGEKVELVRQR